MQFIPVSEQRNNVSISLFGVIVISNAPLELLKPAFGVMLKVRVGTQRPLGSVVKFATCEVWSIVTSGLPPGLVAHTLTVVDGG